MSNALTGAVDTALDLAVVPGYTRFGSLLRRRWWPDDPAPDALRGAAVVVTGANSGLGEATARGVARLGATTYLLVRNPERGAAARARILAAHPEAEVRPLRCDVSDPVSVREACAHLVEEAPRLRALVHNAGAMPPAREETAEGHEVAFATHVLGPHLMTHLLRGSLAADGDGRVVFVSSGGMYTQPLRVDDPEYSQGEYDGVTAYARTKRMQVHLAECWARELAGERVAVHAMHPGWADTPGVKESLPRFRALTRGLLRDADEGADTAVWLAAAPPAGPKAGVETGGFWHDRRVRPSSYLGRKRPDRSQVERLWQICVENTGVPS